MIMQAKVESNARSIYRALGPSVNAVGLSDIGKRARNEDRFVIAELQERWRPLSTDVHRGMLLGVADGIGGRSFGHLASETVLDSVTEHLKGALNAGRGIIVREAMREALVGAHAALSALAKARRLDPGLGTTATLAYIRWPSLYVAHVGDSRCYLYRRGRIRQITQDHTLEMKLIKEGLVSVGDKPAGWTRNYLNNAVTGEHPPRVELHHLCLRREDRVLLCTDGLIKRMSNDTLCQELGAGFDPEVTCRRLVELAKRSGTTDNITCVLGAL